MAIYHCSVKIINRSSGRSSVAAAAYRSGEKLLNQRVGVKFKPLKSLIVQGF